MDKRVAVFMEWFNVLVSVYKFHSNEFGPVSTAVMSFLNIFKLYLHISYLIFSFVVNVIAFFVIKIRANFCKLWKCLNINQEFCNEILPEDYFSIRI